MTRLINIGVEPYLIAASIRAVLAQRLLRKICVHCKEQVELPAAQRLALERIGGGAGVPEAIYRGAGCNRCRNTGYSGRVGVYELFMPDDETLDAISRGATLQEIRKLTRAHDPVTLQHDGLEKVRAGITTVEELLSATAMS